MALRSTNVALALRRTQVNLRWPVNDPRLFGDMIRNFNQKENTDGYIAHSIFQCFEDFQGNNAIYTKSFWLKFKRVYGFLLFFWFAGWAEYFCHMSHKTPGCPWGTHYDPSRERAF